MSGKIVALSILVLTALFGAGMWYAQTRAWYETVAAADLSVTLPSGEVVALPHADFQGLDADTSPLRFRACFTLDAAGMAALAGAAPHSDPEPLVAPAWFDCYDARSIAEALAAGAAQAVMSRHEIARGVDRVIAAFPDGRAYAWHQLNGTLEE